MDIFGSFALLLALAATVYAAVAGTAGILTRKPLLTRSARNAGMMIFPLVTLAVAALEYLFFTNNFSMAYVAEHSNRDPPLLFTNLRRYGPGRKARCFSGASCFRFILFSRSPHKPRQTSGTDALRRSGAGVRTIFLPGHEQFCRQPVST